MSICGIDVGSILYSDQHVAARCGRFIDCNAFSFPVDSPHFSEQNVDNQKQGAPAGSRLVSDQAIIAETGSPSLPEKLNRPHE